MSTYVETWKGIAHALGRSERWCRYMAQRTEDPLPVFKVGGIVRLNGDDLGDWLARQRDRSLSPMSTIEHRGEPHGGSPGLSPIRSHDVRTVGEREPGEVSLKLIA